MSIEKRTGSLLGRRHPFETRQKPHCCGIASISSQADPLARLRDIYGTNSSGRGDLVRGLYVENDLPFRR
jgi:hypothetical protein